MSQATESNPQLKTRAQTLMDTTASKGQYFNADLKQHLTRPINNKPIRLQQQGKQQSLNRQGFQDRRQFDSTKRLQNQDPRNPQGQQQRQQQQRQQQNRPQQQQKFDQQQQRAFIDRRPQKNVSATAQE